MPSRITDAMIFKAHGEMAGSQAAAAFTSKKGKWAKFKAKASNTGIVAIGLSNAVTLPAGTTTSTAGYPLSKDQETDWLEIPNGDLANMYYISENATDHVSYVVMS